LESAYPRNGPSPESIVPEHSFFGGLALQRKGLLRELASRARHKLVSPQETIALRNVVRKLPRMSPPRAGVDPPSRPLPQRPMEGGRDAMVDWTTARGIGLGSPCQYHAVMDRALYQGGHTDLPGNAHAVRSTAISKTSRETGLRCGMAPGTHGVEYRICGGAEQGLSARCMVVFGNYLFTITCRRGFFSDNYRYLAGGFNHGWTQMDTDGGLFTGDNGGGLSSLSRKGEKADGNVYRSKRS
jgi:hypothetical protein